MQRHAHKENSHFIPPPPSLCVTSPERSKQDGRAADKRVIQDVDENASLMKGLSKEERGKVNRLSEEERENITSASGVNRLSEESETLKEIADILLMLRQRKKEG